MKIESFYDGTVIYEQMMSRETELADEDLGFIGGTIKKFKPKTIIELGVSAGGTTCFLLKTLQLLNLQNTKIYSVDIAEYAHRNREKKCGWQIEVAKNYLNNVENHKLILGKNIAEAIEDICESGTKIDMVIMDTIHFLPGELLDFLILYPFLSNNAVIILDDMYFCYTGENNTGYATQLLRNVMAEDVLFADSIAKDKMQGFIVDSNSSKRILNCFMQLSIPWSYKLERAEKYREIINKYYSKDLVNLFDDILNRQNNQIQIENTLSVEIDSLLKDIKDKKVYIYGAGSRGKALTYFLQRNNIGVDGFVISDDRSYSLIKDNVYKLSELEDYADSIIIVAVADDSVVKNLEERNINFINLTNKVFPLFKTMEKYHL